MCFRISLSFILSFITTLPRELNFQYRLIFFYLPNSHDRLLLSPMYFVFWQLIIASFDFPLRLCVNSMLLRLYPSNIKTSSSTRVSSIYRIKNLVGKRIMNLSLFICVRVVNVKFQ